MAATPTVAVDRNGVKTIINKSNFDKTKDKLWVDEGEVTPAPAPEPEPIPEPVPGPEPPPEETVTETVTIPEPEPEPEKVEEEEPVKPTKVRTKRTR